MVRLLLILMIVVVVFSIKYLPVWASVGISLLFLLNLRYLVRYLYKAPYKERGAVLRGATVRVHSVTPAAKPEAPVVESETRSYFLADLTITPAESNSRQWEPADFALVRPESVAEIETQSAGELESIEVWKDGGFVFDDAFNYEGEQRVRILLAARPEVKRVALRYYFEVFGDIALP
jgi:hypothetical protein